MGFCNVEEVPELLSLRIERESFGWVGGRKRERMSFIEKTKCSKKDQIYFSIGERSNFKREGV